MNCGSTLGEVDSTRKLKHAVEVVELEQHSLPQLDPVGQHREVARAQAVGFLGLPGTGGGGAYAVS